MFASSMQLSSAFLATQRNNNKSELSLSTQSFELFCFRLWGRLTRVSALSSYLIVCNSFAAAPSTELHQCP